MLNPIQILYILLYMASYNYNIGTTTLIITTTNPATNLNVTQAGTNLLFNLSTGVFSPTGLDIAAGNGTATITIAISNIATQLTINNNAIVLT